MTDIKIHMVGIGLGDLQHLTLGAREKLLSSVCVYVMSRPDSWMTKFVADLVGKERVRTYMPTSVKWNTWKSDPIFEKIVDEVESLSRAGKDVSFAMAGDVAIYGNVADSVIPLLRERGIGWDVFPGISFLNAISILTGEPIVGEADNFLVTFAEFPEQLDAAFSVANVLILYNPVGTKDLGAYIEQRNLCLALSIVHGVYGTKPSCVDLLTDKAAPIQGLVILKRDRSKKFLSAAVMPQATPIPFHAGSNGWNSFGQLFAVEYPNKLLWSPSGDPSALLLRYSFPDNPDDIRGFFIDSRDNIYVSLKGHKKGSFARTYLSEDQGKTFRKVLNKCCWAFDEDGKGNIFAGVYHEKGDPDGACQVFWSSDHGKNWVDVAPESWRNQNHVHHVAVAPDTGWLYVTLGDMVALRGCWRAKAETWTVSATVPAGRSSIPVATNPATHNGVLGTGPCYFSGGGGAHVHALDSGKLILNAPLTRCIEEGERIILLPWRLKVADADNSIQFVGMYFRGKQIFLGNDTAPVLGEPRVVVFTAIDDGSDEVVTPEPSLQVDASTFGWGCFYLEGDQQDCIWAALRPIKGRGGLWKKAGNMEWEQVFEVPEEDLPCRRGTHTLRDGPLGQTGYGRYLCHQNIRLFPVQCSSCSI